MKLYYFDEKGKAYRFKFYPYLLLVLCLATLLSMTKNDSKTVSYEIEPQFVEIYTGEEPFDFKQFKQFVIECGIRFPDIVLAQSIQEANFKSDIWKENNNPFGLKVAKSRNTTALGEHRGHAQFLNWRMAVLDYGYMQAIFARKIKTRKQYFNYLKNYAEDENYERKLKKILKEYKGFGISDDYLYDL